MNRECLYLVSSSSSREYVLDCLEALALPRGMILHFRYRLKYIDESLRTTLPEGPAKLPTALEELPIVVVYLFQTQSLGLWKPAETMGAGGPYLPLRSGKLVSAFRDGEIAHFFFEVADYIKSDQEGSTRKELNEKVSFKTKDSKPSYAHLAKDLGLKSTKSADTVNFQSIVDFGYLPGEWRTRSLGSTPLDVTYDIIFFRVSGLFKDSPKGLKEITPAAKFVEGNAFSQYELESGATYHMRIVTHLASRVPAALPGEGRAKLMLAFEPGIISPLGPTTLRISSLYDLEYWSFTVRAAKGTCSLLAVECDTDLVVNRQDFFRKELLCPEISFAISVTN